MKLQMKLKSFRRELNRRRIENNPSFLKYYLCTYKQAKFCIISNILSIIFLNVEKDDEEKLKKNFGIMLRN